MRALPGFGWPGARGSRRASAAALTVALAVTAGAAAGTGAPAPRLKPAAVRDLALQATQFVTPGTAFQPDPRLTVEQTRLVHEPRSLLWLVHVHGTVAIFPCRLVPVGAPAPSCIPDPGARPSDDVLVTIADASGRIVSIRPADPAGRPVGS